MSAKIRINNFSNANIIETTELDADVAIGATSLTLKDNQGFVAADYIMIGRRGSEIGELRVVDTVNANLISLTVTAATKLAHNRFDPVTKLFGNKLRIYRASNVDGSVPADGSFSLLTTVDIDPDQTFTDYTDAAGGSDYWYKSTFYNSTTTAETPIADAQSARGGGYGNYASIEEIRDKAGMQHNRWITDAKIDEKRRAAQSVIDATLTGMYSTPFSAPINPLINEITQLLAAGYLLTSEATNASTRAEGQALIDQATNAQGTGWLDKLNKKELKLTGLTGDTETVSDAGGYTAWPNGDTATADADVGGAERGFRISDRY